jgi:hypothetical protein
VLDVRQEILQRLEGAGWLSAAQDGLITDVAAAYGGSVEVGGWLGTAVTEEVYRAIQRLEAFHALAHSQELTAVFERLFGEPVFVHPRNIARVMFPNKRAPTTPPHQDFIHIQGTERAWTAWIPLGDCPQERGGLAVLGGSHKSGVLDYKAADGAGGLEAWICGQDRPWSYGGYRAGDVVMFESRTVHKSMPNSSSRVRLSADFRFQPASEPIVPESLEPHCWPYIRWHDVYVGWRDRALQYYWDRDEMELVNFSDARNWQRDDKIC